MLKKEHTILESVTQSGALTTIVLKMSYDIIVQESHVIPKTPFFISVIINIFTFSGQKV